MRECDVLADEERCPYALECWDVVSTRPSMCAIATSTTSLPPFVFAPVDMSTTFTTAVVVVIIGHSTDYSIIVQYVLSKFIAVYDYWLISVIVT